MKHKRSYYISRFMLVLVVLWFLRANFGNPTLDMPSGFILAGRIRNGLLVAKEAVEKYLEFHPQKLPLGKDVFPLAIPYIDPKQYDYFILPGVYVCIATEDAIWLGRDLSFYPLESFWERHWKGHDANYVSRSRLVENASRFKLYGTESINVLPRSDSKEYFFYRKANAVWLKVI